MQTFQGLAVTSRSRRAGGRDRAGEDTERERIEPLLARNATWATGESTADVDVLAKLRHSRARLSVVPGGVDGARYTPVGPALARSDFHRVLCLAPNPLPCNGFDIVIRALPRVPGTEVVVAEAAATDHSHDEARDQLRHLATELGVADRVRFLGTVGDELPKLLRSVDVVACTPRRPPRATAVLQAMASARAVVTLPVGVLTDVVVHGVTGGSWCHPASEANWSPRVRSLQGSVSSVRAWVRRVEPCMSRFTWDRAALESVTIYGQRGSPLLGDGSAAAHQNGLRRYLAIAA